MPTMQSFTGFASTPDWAGAYNQGMSIANRAAEAQAQIQMEQQKLQQQAEQAQMEASIKSSQLQNQALKDQQQIEIDSAYKQQMVGLQQREVQVKEQALQMGVEKAARSFQASQQYQKEASDLIATGVEPEKAFMQSALKWGPELDMPGSAYTQAFKPQADQENPLGDMQDIPGIPPEVARAFVSGKGSRQYVPTKPLATDGAPQGYVRIGDKTVAERDSIEVRDAKSERKRLVKLQDADIPGQLAAQQAEADPEKPLAKARQLALNKFKERERQIKEQEDKIKGSSRNSGSSRFKEGQTIRSKQDPSKVFIVRNGVPEPIE